jgi:hypothetical protein
MASITDLLELREEIQSARNYYRELVIERDLIIVELFNEGYKTSSLSRAAGIVKSHVVHVLTKGIKE